MHSLIADISRVEQQVVGFDLGRGHGVDRVSERYVPQSRGVCGDPAVDRNGQGCTTCFDFRGSVRVRPKLLMLIGEIARAARDRMIGGAIAYMSAEGGKQFMPIRKLGPFVMIQHVGSPQMVTAGHHGPGRTHQVGKRGQVLPGQPSPSAFDGFALSTGRQQNRCAVARQKAPARPISVKAWALGI
ncbi:hypothetical protein ACQP0C_00700 [Nocardia sp. CA-129566]|uniref:hypothetical protein n=1 Tax=Nocardia sp. CA-129566 TaxID=3239976 RepID=UPI003D997716